MSLNDYQESVFKSRAIPYKATQAIQDRQLMALKMATAQLTDLIQGIADKGEGGQVNRGLFLAKKQAIQNLMVQLAQGMGQDISESVSAVTEETAALMQEVTDKLATDQDQEVDLSNLATVPETVLQNYVHRADSEGLKISPDIWAGNQTALIENQVLSAISRGQSAKSLAQDLEQFINGGSVGMGHSIAYKTMRLARTEINTAYHETRRLSAMASPVVAGMQWRLSNRHPKWDICDLLADQDLYGLGQGVYPSEQLPPKPHPNCICYTMDKLRDPSEWQEPKPIIKVKTTPNSFSLNNLADSLATVKATDNYITKQYQIFEALMDRTIADADKYPPPEPSMPEAPSAQPSPDWLEAIPDEAFNQWYEDLVSPYSKAAGDSQLEDITGFAMYDVMTEATYKEIVKATALKGEALTQDEFVNVFKKHDEKDWKGNSYYDGVLKMALPGDDTILELANADIAKAAENLVGLAEAGTFGVVKPKAPTADVEPTTPPPEADVDNYGKLQDELSFYLPEAVYKDLLWEVSLWEVSAIPSVLQNPDNLKQLWASIAPDYITDLGQTAADFNAIKDHLLSLVADQPSPTPPTPEADVGWLDNVPEQSFLDYYDGDSSNPDLAEGFTIMELMEPNTFEKIVKDAITKGGKLSQEEFEASFKKHDEKDFSGQTYFDGTIEMQEMMGEPFLELANVEVAKTAESLMSSAKGGAFSTPKPSPTVALEDKAQYDKLQDQLSFDLPEDVYVSLLKQVQADNSILLDPQNFQDKWYGSDSNVGAKYIPTSADLYKFVDSLTSTVLSQPSPAPAPEAPPAPKPFDLTPNNTTSVTVDLFDLGPFEGQVKKAKEQGFPIDTNQLQMVSSLGGSTGAKLVKNVDNNEQFVFKQGGNQLHLREEIVADSIYQTFQGKKSVNVPEFEVYQEDNGELTKLAKYLDDTVSLGDVLNGTFSNKTVTADKIKAKVQQGFVLDAVLGNWDVAGTAYDNILITKRGKIYRVDNGGALRFQNQGQTKGGAFADQPNELWSLLDANINPSAAKVFSGLDLAEVKKQAKSLYRQRDQILDNPLLDDELKKKLDRRLQALNDPFFWQRAEREYDRLGIATVAQKKKVDRETVEAYQEQMTGVMAVAEQDSKLGRIALEIDQETVEGLTGNIQKNSDRQGQESYTLEFKVTQASDAKFQKAAKGLGAQKKSWEFITREYDQADGVWKDLGVGSQYPISLLDTYIYQDPAGAYEFKYVSGASGQRAMRGTTRITVNGSLDDFKAQLPQILSDLQLDPNLLAQPTETYKTKLKAAQMLQQFLPNKMWKAGWDKQFAKSSDEQESQELIELAQKEIAMAAGVSTDEVQRWLDDTNMEEGFSGYKVNTVKNKNYQDAIQKDISYLTHNISPENVARVFSTQGSGLMSTRNRFSRGLTVGGASSETDLQTGGADSAFTRVVNKQTGSMARVGGLGGNVMLVLDKQLLNRTDWYAYNADIYGGTDWKKYDHESNRKGAIELGSMGSTSNEVMFRQGIPESAVQGIVCADSETKDTLMRVLNNAGITQIGSMPISDETIQVAYKQAETDYYKDPATLKDASRLLKPEPEESIGVDNDKVIALKTSLKVTEEWYQDGTLDEAAYQAAKSALEGELAKATGTQKAIPEINLEYFDSEIEPKLKGSANKKKKIKEVYALISDELETYASQAVNTPNFVNGSEAEKEEYIEDWTTEFLVSGKYGGSISGGQFSITLKAVLDGMGLLS
jgi:hypothetical protein